MRLLRYLGCFLLFTLPCSPAQTMPNPASEYCHSRQFEEILIGNVGFCRFPDNTYCEEWRYYRGECFPGLHRWPINAADKAGQNMYCVTKDAQQLVLCREQAAQLLQAVRQQQYQGPLDLSDYPLTTVEKQQLFQLLSINKSITALTIKEALTHQEARELADALRVNQGIKALFLQRQSLTAQDYQALILAISANRRLQELNLEANGITDELLAVIFPLLLKNAHLAALNLSNNQLTYKSQPVIMSSLKTNRTLLQLNLRNNALTNAFIEQIQAILGPRLKNAPCLTK